MGAHRKIPCLVVVGAYMKKGCTMQRLCFWYCGVVLTAEEQLYHKTTRYQVATSILVYKAGVVLGAEEQVWEIPTITVCHTSSSFYLRREARQIQEQIQNWFQDRIQHWFKDQIRITSGSGKQLGTICIHLLKATIYWIHQPVPNLYFAFCILLCVTAWKVNTVLTVQEFNQIQNVCVCVLYQPMKSTQYRLQWAKTQ